MTFGLLATGADLGFAGGIERHGVGELMGSGCYGVCDAGEAIAPGAAGLSIGLDSEIRPGNRGGD